MENGAATQLGDGWVKSSLSYANGNCVALKKLAGGGVGVRHSRDIASGGPILAFTPEEWRAFREGLLNGEFDDLG